MPFWASVAPSGRAEGTGGRPKIPLGLRFDRVALVRGGKSGGLRRSSPGKACRASDEQPFQTDSDSQRSPRRGAMRSVAEPRPTYHRSTRDEIAAVRASPVARVRSAPSRERVRSSMTHSRGPEGQDRRRTSSRAQARARERGPECIAVEAPILVANVPRRSSRVTASRSAKTTSPGALRVRSMRRVDWKTSAAQVSTSGAQ